MSKVQTGYYQKWRASDIKATYSASQTLDDIIEYVNVDVSINPVPITLPDATSPNIDNGKTIWIYDSTGNAYTNIITILPNPGDTTSIEGKTFIVLDADNASIILELLDDEWIIKANTIKDIDQISSGLLTTIDGTNVNLISSAGGNDVAIKGGTGYIVDRSNVLNGNTTVNKIRWDSETVDVTSLLPSPSGNFVLAKDSNGDNVMFDNNSASTLTSSQFNTHIELGALTANSGNVGSVSAGTLPSYNSQQNIYALARVIGVVNSKGNPFSILPSVAFPALLRVRVSGGDAASVAGGFVFNEAAPMIVTHASELDPATLIGLALRSGAFSFSATSEIDPTQYEDPIGTLNLVVGNKFTLQRVFLFPANRIVGVIYGDKVFNSLALAVAEANSSPPFIPLLASAFHIADLAIQSNATDFTDPTQFEFLGVI